MSEKTKSATEKFADEYLEKASANFEDLKTILRAMRNDFQNLEAISLQRKIEKLQNYSGDLLRDPNSELTLNRQLGMVECKKQADQAKFLTDQIEKAAEMIDLVEQFLRYKIDLSTPAKVFDALLSQAIESEDDE